MQSSPRRLFHGSNLPKEFHTIINDSATGVLKLEATQTFGIKVGGTSHHGDGDDVYPGAYKTSFTPENRPKIALKGSRMGFLITIFRGRAVCFWECISNYLNRPDVFTT